MTTSYIRSPFVLSLLASLSCVLVPSARAAETDPYYAWLHPPRDGTAALNRAIQTRLERGLARVNRRSDPDQLSCRDVVAEMTAPLSATAFWFFSGNTTLWGMDFSPRSRTEYVEDLEPKSIYRDALLLPFGRVVPLDPAVSADGVLFGTDKLGHFFTNGRRGFFRYLDARERGESLEEAEGAALDVGIKEESGWLGFGISGVFSYADLYVNLQGVRFLRELCEEGGLEVEGESGSKRWVMTQRFDITRFVDPCWDEGFYPSAFAGHQGRVIQAGVFRLCRLLDAPQVRHRLERYDATGCDARFRGALDGLAAAGRAHDPSPWSLRDVCDAADGGQRLSDDSARSDVVPTRP